MVAHAETQVGSAHQAGLHSAAPSAHIAAHALCILLAGARKLRVCAKVLRSCNFGLDDL